MTKRDLQRWAEKACEPLSGCIVPWVAAGSPHAREIALEWIESGKDLIAAAGWATLSGLVALKEDADLDLAELKRLLQRVQQKMHTAPDKVRYAMNGFVIAVAWARSQLLRSARRNIHSIPWTIARLPDDRCAVSPHHVDSIAATRASAGAKYGATGTG